MTITIAEAQQPFDLCWDANGLVHVFAGNKADAFRGMGYAAGFERLWQIHLSTLFATGTAASVMGPRYISQDLMHRAFNVPAFDMPDSPGDWVVDAYLEGLNSYVRELTEIPPEFLRAGTIPREFTRHDVASRHRFTGWFQHKTFMEKIYMGKLMARHGSHWFKDFLHNFSEADEKSVLELQEALQVMDAGVGKLLFPKQEILSGSNNWAVRSHLSSSGKPLLATDPHQPHSIPNTFFYVHLNAPNWDVFGATFPGIPYFMMGFNSHVSWGLTTGFIDTFDVFVEKDDAPHSKHFDIDVAGQESVSFDVAMSDRGPILESLSDGLGLSTPKDRQYTTSLNWVMKDIPTSAGTLALMPLAENSKEFGESLFENDICPLVNNIIAVDQGDDMRRFIAATVQKRPGHKRAGQKPNGVTGSVPLAAWHPEYNFELSSASELLAEHNPACGYSLTANNDTIGDTGTFPIHNFPTFDSRAARIKELIEQKVAGVEGATFTSQDFELMQQDVVDLRAVHTVSAIAGCLTGSSEQVQRARKILEAWDCKADVNSKAACIFYPLQDKRWHIKFMHEVLGDDLLLSLPVVAVAINRFGVDDFFTDGSPWLEHRKSLEKILCAEVLKLVDNLDRQMGEDWSWGKLHQISFKHSLSKYSDWADMHVGPDPISGSGTTLRMALHTPAVDDTEKVRVYHGPAFRWVVDLADPLHFRCVIAGGNSGRAESGHFADQYKHWLEGKYYDVSLVREELDIEKTIHVV
ncbi:MAG: penicillin amidase [Oceanicoccus sp.]|jgi:penicillin amidase